ncbi:MAG: hypothetical protein AUH78_07730 [Gemmatimonadetes bacterium 13_1_40CM_4_69_8]|nr:MAG: hypothetical protein AUH78_07730 [Gemmatimonadetes bacterium 13_1_40CM_4_69_8]
MAVLGKQLFPQLRVPLLHTGELDVDLLLLLVRLLTRQHQVQVGGVVLVLPVVQPVVHGSVVEIGHAGR